jgi:imidazolonepropionase-like amidohydrolase
MKLKALLLMVLFSASQAICQEAPGSLVLLNGQYFDGEVMQSFSHLVVRDGDIVSVDGQLPSSVTKTYDCQGKFVIPGLTDAHVHLMGNPTVQRIGLSARANLESSLVFGVTTQLDLFMSVETMNVLRAFQEEDPSALPNFMTAGPCLATVGGHGSRGGYVVGAMQSATKQTQRLMEADVDFIKIIHQLEWDKINHSQEDLNNMVQIAHENGKKVFMHTAHNQDIEMGLMAGVDIFAHNCMERIPDYLLEAMVQNSAAMVPTQTVYKVMMKGMEEEYLNNSYFRSHLPKAYGAVLDSGAIAAGEVSKAYADRDSSYEHMMDNLRRFVAFGGVILAGTDAGNTHTYYGYSLHHELAEYAKAGIETKEVLRSATYNLFDFFPDLKTGRIEPGFKADLVILNADPFLDIKNTLNIDQVIRAGKLVKMP